MLGLAIRGLKPMFDADVSCPNTTGPAVRSEVMPSPPAEIVRDGFTDRAQAANVLYSLTEEFSLMKMRS